MFPVLYSRSLVVIYFIHSSVGICHLLSDMLLLATSLRRLGMRIRWLKTTWHLLNGPHDAARSSVDIEYLGSCMIPLLSV